MGESSIRDGKFSNFRYCPATNFCLLAVETVSGPSGNISAEGRPDKLVAHHLPGAFNARVPKAVDGLKNALAPREGHEGTCRAVRYVDVKVKVTDRDFTDCESGVWVGRDASKFRVEWLVAGHLGEIDAKRCD